MASEEVRQNSLGGLEISPEATFPRSTNLDETIRGFMQILDRIEVVIQREVQNGAGQPVRCCLFYIDGMVNSGIINESIIERIQRTETPLPAGEALLDALAEQVISVNEIKTTNNLQELIQGAIYGDTVLFAEGSARGLIINTKGFALRSTGEPENEKVLRGPHEGFTEGIIANLSRLRRILRTQNLKMEFTTFGRHSNTKACICYIEGIAEPKVLAELRHRLAGYDLDGALDVNYLIETIKDAPHTPFKTVGTTERPDVVAGKLLEGRIALVLDGTPVVLTLPYLFVENFQSSEDYYVSYLYSSVTRMLRILGFFITICLPGLYVAVVTYHHELLPTPLLVSFSMARQAVPFPTVVEAFLMIVVFQLLAETGMRMANGIGQALSIVGALVIGQASVEARIVSAPIIIVVGLTGITGLLVPKLNAATILLRFGLLALSSVLGLYGFTFGMIALLLQLYGMESFGIPFLQPFSMKFQRNKDSAIRAPWWKMVTRPEQMSQNRVRKGGGDQRA